MPAAGPPPGTKDDLHSATQAGSASGTLPPAPTAASWRNAAPERYQALARLARFYVTGGINTAFGYGLYAMMITLGLHPQTAQLLSRIAGIMFNFFTYRSLVFGNSNFPLSRFLLAYGLNYLASVAFLDIALTLQHDPYIAGVATTVFSTLLQFCVLSRFVAIPSGKSGAPGKSPS
ncbi:GtrA family protein [Novosphingobium clariflavum]|uniref:GtrA family protein n=1 Tax=Novosphingobium clariflavum TaxID=2029884 RepID=A0ABV6SDB9_9SPHN|nr:GtrA family protein [Novosphingobium clariflavum]